MNPGDRKALVIARRSRKNLEFIYQKKKLGADVEEFTQLLNSMLGMLICLREEYFKGKEIDWEAVRQCGLTPIPIDGDNPDTVSPNLRHSDTFSRLIGRLRHAFAHNCFELVGNPILGLKAWNVPTDMPNEPQNRIWQAYLTEKQLLDVANLFIDYLEAKHGADLAPNET